MRAEACRLRLNVTELQGDIAVRADTTTALEVQLSKLSSQCEVSYNPGHILVFNYFG